MKKLLALVLALVMTLGLATVSASAATTKYADKNDIEYQEAADVLSKVGVFEGKGENFAPKDNLNRAEAAKLVAYLMLGNKTAEAIKGNGNRFSDVPADHWAVGYIEYLATAGVVSGVGGGNFNPNGQVTAVQFAKMLNVALGYDAQVEGYVGESWNINIMKQANDDEIFKTLDISSNDALTREQAAQMCLNALKANVVEYESKGDTLTINNSTVVLNAKKAKDKTTTATKGNAIKDDDAAGTTNDPYTLQLGEELYNGDLKMEKTNDDFGRPANKWTYKLEKIDTYVDYGILKAEYTDEIKRGPLYDTLGSSVYDHLVTGIYDTNYARLYYSEDGVTTWVNDSTTAATNKTAVENYIQKNGDAAINSGNSSGRGTLTQVFVDKDDNTYITVVNTYVFKASSDYRTSTEDIVVAVPTGVTGIALDSTRLELKDHPQIKDMKKDDYILVTAHHDTPNAVYEVKTADKAELLTAKVDKYVKDDSVTLDGTTYKYDKKIDTTSKGTEYSIGQETTVVLDKYGYIMYVDEAVVSANYVFISELFQNGGSTSKVQANAYFTDGTNATITVKEIAGTTGKTALVGNKAGNAIATKTFTGVVSNEQYYTGWYTYNKNSSGEYTLNKLSSTYDQEVELLKVAKNTVKTDFTKSDTVQFIRNGAPVTNATYKYSNMTGGTPAADNTIKAQAAKANDKTIFVVTYGDKNDVDVYTGVKNLPDIVLSTDGKTAGNGTVFSVLDANGYAKYVFASVDGSYSVYGSENESLLYIIKLDKKNVISSDTTYYTYKALDENAKEISVEADGDTAFGTDSTIYRTFYKTSKNADGRYTRGEKVTDGAGTTKYVYQANKTNTITASNGTLSIAGSSYTLADNYRLIVISQADALNKKQGADYEANVVTAEGLAAMVQGYTVTYNFEAKKDSNTNDKLVEAYVTITDATTGKKTSGATTTGDIVAVKLTDAMRGITSGNVDFTKGTDITYYYGGNVQPGNTDIALAISQELQNYSALSNLSVGYDSKNTQFVVYDQYGATYATMKADPTGVRADLTSGSSWTFDGTAPTDVDKANGVTVVVPAGKTLTVDGKTLNADTLIVAGTLVIKNSGVVNAKTEAHVLYTGHITVDGGTYKVNGADKTKDTIEGTSIEATDDDANVVDLGPATSTGSVTIGGGYFKATLDSYGTTTISGSTTEDATTIITVKAGTTAVAASVDTNGSTISNDGGTATVAGVTIDEGKSNSNYATEISKAQSEAATAAEDDAISGTVTISASGKDINVKPTAGLKFQSNKDFVSVYTLTDDTVSFTLEYIGKSENGSSATVSVATTAPDTKEYTLTKEITIGSKEAKTLSDSETVTVKTTESVTIELTATAKDTAKDKK